MPTETTYGVAPNTADWYYCAVVDYGTGDSDHIDGYATGPRPTVRGLRAHTACRHSWVSGMCKVHEEDLESVSASRPVTCERCDLVYGCKPKPLFQVLEWEVKATPQGAYGKKVSK